MKNDGAEMFLQALERKARMMAPGARANVEANHELCSWLLDPLGAMGFVGLRRRGI